jgi:hypothetical protein
LEERLSERKPGGPNVRHFESVGKRIPHDAAKLNIANGYIAHSAEKARFATHRDVTLVDGEHICLFQLHVRTCEHNHGHQERESSRFTETDLFSHFKMNLLSRQSNGSSSGGAGMYEAKTGRFVAFARLKNLVLSGERLLVAFTFTSATR